MRLRLTKRALLLRSWLAAPAAAVAATALALSLAIAQPRAQGAATPLPVGDAARGERLYTARCGACHSLDANRIGPSHRGVVGRRSGQAPNFRYSVALQRLNVVWTPQTLDRWLTSPTAMAPGTSMGIRVLNAQERADIITYLGAQTGTTRR